MNACTAKPIAVRVRRLPAASSSATRRRLARIRGNQASTTWPWMRRLSTRTREITGALSLSGPSVLALQERVAHQRRGAGDVLLTVAGKGSRQLRQWRNLRSKGGRLQQHRQVDAGN